MLTSFRFRPGNCAVATLLAGAVLLVGGCGPNLAAASAGQIGCPASDIKITDDNPGWGTRTWTATCAGRTYQCSYAQTGIVTGRNVSGYSGQFSCAPEQSTASGAPVRTSGGADTRKRTTTPPLGTGGFAFGRVVEEVRSACTDAGSEWTEGAQNQFSCSGTASDIGISASTRLTFRGEKLDVVVLVLAPSETVVDTFAKLDDTLTKKYGKADRRERDIPRECEGGKEAFASCLSDGKLRLAVHWHWQSGESIELSLGKDQGDGAPTVKVRYGRSTEAPSGADGL
jgi:hypothetical protein